MSAILDTLHEVWKSCTLELVIFAVTLFVALFARMVNTSPTTSKVEAVKPPSPVSGGKAAPRGRQQPPAHASKWSSGERTLPRMVQEIVSRVQESANLRAAVRSLNVYNEELRDALKREGVNIKDVAKATDHTPLEMYTTLVQCAIRLGKYDTVVSIMDDMKEQVVARPLSFYESAMRQLAGQKQYQLALSVYYRLAEDGLRPSAVTCSCLVGFSAEVGNLQQAVEFFNQLCEMTTPSVRAYMTVLRVHAKRQDFDASLELLRDMDRRNIGMDTLALNVTLATGVACGRMKDVKKLLYEADDRTPRISDVVSYNTLLKGYSQRGDTEGALALLARMSMVGMSPNNISYNTAMDAAVRGDRLPAAWAIVEQMRLANIPPDKFSCSILGKGLQKKSCHEFLGPMLDLLKELDLRCDPVLKSQVYHSVLEAAVDAKTRTGDASLAIRAFSQMRQCRVEPSSNAQRLLVQVLPAADAL